MHVEISIDFEQQPSVIKDTLNEVTFYIDVCLFKDSSRSLPDFIRWRTRYESVNYEISNY